ncbi:MAG: NAD-dependent epimerase/dehydratase family protein [Acidimicrobiales bacterium]
MKVLVTGGAGFIGSHVVDQLLDRGVEVRILDSLDPTVHPVEPPYLDHRAELVKADIADADAVAHAVRGVDAVCHQAAKVGLGVDFGDVGSYVDTNDVGTAVLLKTLWQDGFRGRFVLAGSMVVYGEGRSQCPEHGVVVPGARRAADLEAGRFEARCPHCDREVGWEPVVESAPPDPRNVYAATKLHQEHLCMTWAAEAGAAVTVLRYHNVYGPRMPCDTPYAGVASIFRSAVAHGRAPRVFEDGGQTRDFVHVHDVARANLLALLGEAAEPGVYNIASGTPHTVLDMATAIAAAVPGVPAPEVTGEWRIGDVRHIVASARRANNGLGFSAEVDFGVGMAEFAHAELRPAPV